MPRQLRGSGDAAATGSRIPDPATDKPDPDLGTHAPKDYTSGSESDEEVFTKHGTANNPGAIKKKKRKVPPQESVDRMWRRFSAPKFGRTLAILPFAPVAASATPERGNELLTEGYERAMTECRR